MFLAVPPAFVALVIVIAPEPIVPTEMFGVPLNPPAVPEVFPVTLPVRFPSIFATSVPVVIVRLPVLAPVNEPVPTVNLSAL